MAFRLEPMQNAVDAAAWLGFHVVLEMFGVKAAAAVDSDRPGQVFREDRRCVCANIHAYMHPFTHTWTERRVCQRLAAQHAQALALATHAYVCMRYACCYACRCAWHKRYLSGSGTSRAACPALSACHIRRQGAAAG